MVSSIPILQVKRLVERAIIPMKGSLQAAGYDLHAVDAGVVPKRGKALVGTGLAFGIPEGNYGRIAPRSGLAAKNSIDVGAGVIDSDYRGEVKVLLFNFSDEDFSFNQGDRIAQMIIEKYTMTQI
jgi:dUTP pyrophosphatase